MVLGGFGISGNLVESLCVKGFGHRGGSPEHKEP